MARKRSQRSVASAGFVLDCSVTLGWFFADERSAFADAVAASLATLRAIVPPLWHFEVANCMLVGERRDRCTEAQTTAFLARLAGFPIATDQMTARNWIGVIAVARQHSLSAYDAAYLELAMRRSLPLATLDKKLLHAASSAGIGLFAPTG